MVWVEEAGPYWSEGMGLHEESESFYRKSEWSEYVGTNEDSSPWDIEPRPNAPSKFWLTMIITKQYMQSWFHDVRRALTQ